MPFPFRLFNQLPSHRWILVLLFTSIFLNSCLTNKKITYLQDYNRSLYSDEYVPPETYLIKANDNLYVRVATLDPRFSEFFNPSVAGGDAGGTRMDEQSAALLSYPVQEDGKVDIPYVGPILVAGKTLAQAKEDIEAVLVDYVTDATVTVRLVNNYVTVLGSVNDPGMYLIYKDRLNVFQALALAGDIIAFGDRYTLSIVRQTNAGSEVREFNITDKKLIDSEYYYVLPNDILYVKPMKGRFFGLETFPYGVLFSSITAFISIFVLIQNSIIINQ